MAEFCYIHTIALSFRGKLWVFLISDFCSKHTASVFLRPDPPAPHFGNSAGNFALSRRKATMSKAGLSRLKRPKSLGLVEKGQKLSTKGKRQQYGYNKILPSYRNIILELHIETSLYTQVEYQLFKNYFFITDFQLYL